VVLAGLKKHLRLLDVRLSLLLVPAGTIGPRATVFE
jgi:hypothetical protein